MSNTPGGSISGEVGVIRDTTSVPPDTFPSGKNCFAASSGGLRIDRSICSPDILLSMRCEVESGGRAGSGLSGSSS